MIEVNFKLFFFNENENITNLLKDHFFLPVHHSKSCFLHNLSQSHSKEDIKCIEKHRFSLIKRSEKDEYAALTVAIVLAPIFILFCLGFFLLKISAPLKKPRYSQVNSNASINQDTNETSAI